MSRRGLKGNKIVSIDFIYSVFKIAQHFFLHVLVSNVLVSFLAHVSQQKSSFCASSHTISYLISINMNNFGGKTFREPYFFTYNILHSREQPDSSVVHLLLGFLSSNNRVLLAPQDALVYR